MVQKESQWKGWVIVFDAYQVMKGRCDDSILTCVCYTPAVLYFL